jgi:hypothetical protein
MDPTIRATDITALLGQYNNVHDIREACIRNYAKSNFFFGFTLAVFALAEHFNIDYIFLFIPFVIIAQNSIVLYNQYHQFMAEVYLEELEKKLTKDYGIDEIRFYSFYNRLFKLHAFKTGQLLLPAVIKPTAILMVALFIIYTGLFITCVIKSREYIQSFANYQALSLTYLIITCSLYATVLIGYLQMPKTMKIVLKKKLESLDLELKTAERLRSTS